MNWEALKEQVRQGHAFFDMLNASWAAEYRAAGGTVHCGRGCAGCCTLAVNCSFPEALTAAEKLQPEQAQRVATRAARLREAAASAPGLVSFLRMHRREIGPCPFLVEEGACGVYSLRPFSCRSLLSTRESRWCSVDFSTLADEEKRQFLQGLDERVCAFPLHYAAHPQQEAREMESDVARRMEKSFAISLYGNFPYLAWLELEHGMSRLIAAGEAADYLRRRKLDHPFLLTVSSVTPSS